MTTTPTPRAPLPDSFEYSDPLDHHDVFFQSLCQHRYPLPIALNCVPFELTPARSADFLTITDTWPAHADPLILFTLFPLTTTCMAVYFMFTAPSTDHAMFLLLTLMLGAMMAYVAYRIRTAVNRFSISFADRSCTFTRRRMTTSQRHAPVEDVRIIVRPCTIKLKPSIFASFTGTIVFVASGKAVVVCAVTESPIAAADYADSLRASTGIDVLHENVLVAGYGVKTPGVKR